MSKAGQEIGTVEPGERSVNGLIIRQKEPPNLEMPFDRADSFLTPPELFYIRSHFTPPEIELESYRLQVDGAVRYPLSLTYAEIKSLPAETRTATLECAGNGRVFLVPQADGAQWQLGAIGNAEWTGVRLSVLLERAVLEGNVREILLEGADSGMPKEQPLPPAPIFYARSLPLEKALKPEVLVAFAMNGRDLSLDHGFPLRAIVPGHYGMASVKWLTRIHALEERFDGYFQTSDYAYWDRVAGNPVRRALGEMKIKSQIARPSVYETLPPDQDYTIIGAAWAGEAFPTEVKVSADGGQTWMQAEWLDPAQRHVWRRWSLRWRTPDRPGKYTLMSSAMDEHGAEQRAERDKSYGSYAVHHHLPVEIFIGSAG